MDNADHAVVVVVDEQRNLGDAGPEPQRPCLVELAAGPVPDRVVAEAVEPEQSSTAGAPAGGDVERLRGLPAVSRYTRGAVFGTDPVRAMVAKESRRRKY